MKNNVLFKLAVVTTAIVFSQNTYAGTYLQCLNALSAYKDGSKAEMLIIATQVEDATSAILVAETSPDNSYDRILKCTTGGKSVFNWANYGNTTFEVTYPGDFANTYKLHSSPLSKTLRPRKVDTVTEGHKVDCRPTKADVVAKRAQTIMTEMSDTYTRIATRRAERNKKISDTSVAAINANKALLAQLQNLVLEEERAKTKKFLVSTLDWLKANPTLPGAGELKTQISNELQKRGHGKVNPDVLQYVIDRYAYNEQNQTAQSLRNEAQALQSEYVKAKENAADSAYYPMPKNLRAALTTCGEVPELKKTADLLISYADSNAENHGPEYNPASAAQ